MIKRLLSTAVLSAACSLAYAQNSGFLTVSLNRLNWSGSTIARSNVGPIGQKTHFTYLELEAGKAGEWGDLYGFADIENPHHANDYERDPRGNRRFVLKLAGRHQLSKIAGVPLFAYAQIYDLRDKDFFDQNRVFGLSTELSAGKLWIKPFLGMHQEFKSGIGAQSNGGMAGYVAGYDFSLAGQALSLTQWHETEFSRRSQFLTMAEPDRIVTGHRSGQNGAVSLWWKATADISTGLSYRYANHKLGVAGTEDGWIYTLKYHFK